MHLHRGRHSEGVLAVVTATAVFYREPLCWAHLIYWTTAHGLQLSWKSTTVNCKGSHSGDNGGWDTSGKLPGERARRDRQHQCPGTLISHGGEATACAQPQAGPVPPARPTAARVRCQRSLLLGENQGSGCPRWRKHPFIL